MSLSGNDLMWLALTHNDLNKLEAAAENGADPNTRRNGLTPLEYLFLHNDKETATIVDMLNLLLGSGADTNLKKIFGKQPLYLAAEKNFTQSVELLLKFGADKERRYAPLGPLGRMLGMSSTPFQAAQKAGYTKTAEILSLFDSAALALGNDIVEQRHIDKSGKNG